MKSILFIYFFIGNQLNLAFVPNRKISRPKSEIHLTIACLTDKPARFVDSFCEYIDPNDDSDSSLPKGNYKKTAKSIELNGNTLTADLKRRNGEYVQASITLPHPAAYVINDNGTFRYLKLKRRIDTESIWHQDEDFSEKNMAVLKLAEDYNTLAGSILIDDSSEAVVAKARAVIESFVEYHPKCGSSLEDYLKNSIMEKLDTFEFDTIEGFNTISFSRYKFVDCTVSRIGNIFDEASNLCEISLPSRMSDLDPFLAAIDNIRLNELEELNQVMNKQSNRISRLKRFLLRMKSWFAFIVHEPYYDDDCLDVSDDFLEL